MSPTARNRLMVGGALILIALLLVCGPLSDRFGGGGKNGGVQTPSVAAAPPVDATGLADAAATGALAGAAAGDVVAADAGSGMGGGSKVAPIAVAAAAGTAGAGAAAAGSGGGGGSSGAAAKPAVSSLPPVSAGVPATNVAAPLALAAAGSGAVAATDAFDDSIGDDEELAGRAADRFAPPVASPGGSPLALVKQPFSVAAGSMIRPCDTPGSGCTNLVSPVAPPPVGGGVPPIGPGVRPGSQPRSVPPISPGTRVTPTQ